MEKKKTKKFYWVVMHRLQGVGFEPTRIATEDLKSSPLDHSGTLANIIKTPILSIILLSIPLLKTIFLILKVYHTQASC